MRRSTARPDQKTRAQDGSSPRRAALDPTQARAAANTCAVPLSQASAERDRRLSLVYVRPMRSPPSTTDIAASPEMSSDRAVELYQAMVSSRALDVALFGSGRAVETAVEQAVSLGVAAALAAEDWLFLGPGGIAAAFWRGRSASEYARLSVGAGRLEAWKAAESHRLLIEPRRALGPPSRDRAGRVGHAVGVAWAARLRHAHVVSAVVFDDAGSSSGDYHAGLTFAGVSRAPVVAVHMKHSTRPDSTFNSELVAAAYGLRGASVAGTDVFAVWHAVTMARERSLEGLGGTIIQADMEPTIHVDPVAETRLALEARDLWNAELDDAYAQRVAEQVRQALTVREEFAVHSAGRDDAEDPDARSLGHAVYP